MWAFLIIDVCDKISDAISRFGDALIVIDVNFFLLEGANESFGVSVLPRATSVCDGKIVLYHNLGYESGLNFRWQYIVYNISCYTLSRLKGIETLFKLPVTSPQFPDLQSTFLFEVN